MAEVQDRCVVAGSQSYESQQGPTYAPGVSAETVGAKALFLGVVTMDPGILDGTPVFAGTDVPVKTLLEHLMDAQSLDGFFRRFPNVSRQKVNAFLDQLRSRFA